MRTGTLPAWKRTTVFKQGDVVLCWYPHSDLVSLKRRPALVVQADDLETGLPQIVVAMITTNLARLGHQSRVALPVASSPDQATGLLADSVVMTDNLATVLEKAIDRKIGHVPDFGPVQNALRATLGV